ncbi:MAG: hypothetical protein MJZ11_08490 [Lachnospiraceae bacterium]|nr:hypothetical protein [Lachnospiraceae bacterium]
MKKYEEEFEKSTERNRMSFIATLAVKELMEEGKLTKEDLVGFVKKNAEEQKHPERADDLVAFIDTMEPKKFLNMFGWRIFDLKQFYEYRKNFRKEIRDKHIKETEERLEKARAEKAAKKAKNVAKNQPKKKVEPAPAPKKKIIVVKKPQAVSQSR